MACGCWYTSSYLIWVTFGNHHCRGRSKGREGKDLTDTKRQKTTQAAKIWGFGRETERNYQQHSFPALRLSEGFWAEPCASLSLGFSSPEVPEYLHNTEEKERERKHQEDFPEIYRSYTSAQKEFWPKIPHKIFRRLAGGGRLLHNLLRLQIVCAALHLLHVVTFMLWTSGCVSALKEQCCAVELWSANVLPLNTRPLKESPTPSSPPPRTFLVRLL